MPDATQLTKLVSGMAREEKRKERLLDSRERTERFEVAGAAAVTFRPQAADSGDALVGDEHMAQLSAITSSTRDDVAIGDHAAAARGPRSIEADNGHGVERDTGQRGGNFEAGRDLLEADLRTFARKCGMLAEFLDEEL